MLSASKRAAEIAAAPSRDSASAVDPEGGRNPGSSWGWHMEENEDESEVGSQEYNQVPIIQGPKYGLLLSASVSCY